MRVFFLRLFTVLMFMVLLVGCSGGGGPSPGERLQASVDANWNNYKETHGLPGGGMAVYLETPTGNYFASSGMAAGVDQNTRFRIASNTKTFTAGRGNWGQIFTLDNWRYRNRKAEITRTVFN